MKALTLLSLLTAASLIAAEDPAAHTVIVPYDASQRLPPSQAPQRYYLPYDSFQSLWKAAKENRAPRQEETDTSAQATIHSATYRGRIEENALVLTARLEIMTRGEWTPVSLPLSSGEGDQKKTAALREVRIDGRPAAPEGDQVRVPKPGAHTIEFTVSLPPLLPGQPKTLSFPPALAGILYLEAPPQDGPLLTNRSVLPAADHAPEGRVFTVPLVDVRSNWLTLERTTRGLPRGEGPVPTATVTTALTLRELLPDHIRGRLELSFPGAARRTLAFSVDEDVTVESVTVHLPAGNGRFEIGQRMSTRSEGGRTHVLLTLDQEISHRAEIDFTGLRPRGRGESPLIQAAAARGQQQVTVLAEEGMEVSFKPLEGLTRLPNQISSAREFHTAGIFKLPGASRLPYEVKTATALDEAAVDYVFQVSEQKSELLAAVSLKRKQGLWQTARIRTPAGYEVQSITGPALRQWQHAGDELFLHFDPARAGSDARVIVHLARTVVEPVTSWKILPLQPVGFEKQTGRALIAAHAAMQVRLPDISGNRDLQELDPTALDSTFAIAPPFEKKRGLSFDGLTWSLEVALARQPARFSVEAVALVLVSDSGIRISQQVAAIVDQGALRQVTVRLPATLPEAAVSGPLLREMRSRVEGAERIYECSFQTDVLDRTELTFDHDLPLAPTLAVPLARVADAQRLQRFFVLDNASAREARVTDTAALETVSRDVIPYLPEGLGRPQFFRATSDDSRLTISYTELTGTEANAALVTLADITTVLRADGERWDTVVYSLVNRSLQFLPVILPRGAELISASVSGETVRADQETRDGRALHLIPLIHTKPGQRALEVRLVWRFPPADWRNARLDDPELAGLSAERTGWTVWTPPGYQLKDFDGNMEEVEAQDRDLQKLEGMLSELGDVNRELASGKLDYAEAKDAYSSANRLAEEIRAAKDAVFGRGFRSRREKTPEKDGMGDKKVADLEKGVSEQKELLEGKWKEYEGKDKENGRAAGKPAGKVGLKTDWNFNKSGEGKLELQSKANTFSGSTIASNGAQVVNDNIAVNNGFFANQPVAPNQSIGGFAMGNQSQGLVQNGSNTSTSNARANNLSQTGANAALPGNAGALSISGGGNVSGAPMAGAAAAAPSDPFAAPTRAVGQSLAPERPALPAGPLPPPVAEARQQQIDINGAASSDDRSDSLGLAAQTLESLRPTGRRSLAVEVPVEGEVRHFTKLKDHAVLELQITRPLDPERTRSAWFLGIGLLILVGWSRLGSRRHA